MIRIKKYLFVTTISLALVLFLPPPLFSYELAKRVQSFTLKNELRLLMVERHQSLTVSIYIRYRAGVLDEVDGKTGTAHLLEHVMFKGTRTSGIRSYHLEEKNLSKIEEVGVNRSGKMKETAADKASLARLTLQLATRRD
jgi:predicted Zn-dependent peptidase